MAISSSECLLDDQPVNIRNRIQFHLRSYCLALCLCLIGNLSAQIGNKADLSTAAAWHDGSSASYLPTALYDGDTTTLGMANYADEPVSFTFLFPSPIIAAAIRVHWTHAWGNPAYRWDAGCADDISDLVSQAGSYHALANNVETPSSVWSEVVFPDVTCSAFRITGYRLTGDHFLHVSELEIILDPSDPQSQGNLVRPAGLDKAADGTLVIADAGRDALLLMDSAGSITSVLGEGILNAPMDVAVDSEQRYIVADTGNDRVVRFSIDGSLDSVLASAGTAPSQVLAPEGVSIDQYGRLLIADTGNHRVIRLDALNLPDPSFGVGGIVGGPVPVSIGDDGFNSPSGVEWDPYRDQLLVSDTGNNRLQVLDSDGSYVRTVDGVYGPHAATIRRDGTIFAVGDGEYFPPVSGSVRLIKPEAEFVSEQIFNGNSEIAMQTGGVLSTGDGDIVVTGSSDGSLLRIPPDLRPEIEAFTFEASATELTVRYRTRIATSTELYWGELELTSKQKQSTPTFEHEITATGLLPDTNYIFTVTYPRSLDHRPVFLPMVRFRTEPANTQMMNVMQLRTVGVIYTHGLTSDEVRRARERLMIVEEFFFRHSHGRLHLDIEILEVNREYTRDDIHDYGGFKASSVESDLVAAGYDASDQIDELIVFFGGVQGLPGGNYGGGGGLFGRFIGYCSYVTAWPFVAIHEVSHTLDSIYAHSGYQAYGFNHGLWAIGSSSGKDLIVNGEILGMIPVPTFATLSDPFQRVIQVLDPDHDGLTEHIHFPVTESSTNADPSRRDTDFDGVSDLLEMLAGTTLGTNPRVVDSDGDGASQGSDRIDRNPLLPIEGYVKRATPQVDGIVRGNEGWTLISNRTDLKNPFLNSTLVDSNQHQDTRVWAAWDADALYLAMEYEPASIQLDIDGNGDGWFSGYDNYRLEFDTRVLKRVAVAAADRDLMFSIHSSGGWSEIFDDSDKWLSAPPGGLNLDRIVNPDDVHFARSSGLGDFTVAEIRIPVNPRAEFFPSAGLEVKLYARLDSDVLWDEDRFVRILLVDGDDDDGDGLWNLQEIDLGSNPELIDGDSDGLMDTEELARGYDPLKGDTDDDDMNDSIDPLPLDPRRIVSTPSAINATDGKFVDKVRVSWDDVTGEDSFVVYRCVTTDPDSCLRIVTTASGETTYDDFEASPEGVVHLYRVVACSKTNGCSGLSSPDSGHRYEDLIFGSGFENWY